MKKILAALLAVVMVMSCMSFAFAETLDCYTMGEHSSSRRKVMIEGEVQEGTKISFWIKPVLGETCTVEGCEEDWCEHGIPSVYVRTNGSSSGAAYYLDAEGNDTGVKCYSGEAVAKNALKEVDGWYYVECITKVTGDTYEISVNCQHSEVAEGCLVAGVLVGGEPATLSNTVGDKTTMETPVAPEETTGGVEETTGGVEETGVVSIAVVAVAAVIGGAVVLKKREF